MAKKTNTKTTYNVPPVKQPLGVPVKTAREASSFSARNLCIILSVISFVLYANTMQNGYALDDTMVLKENTIVAKGIKAIPELLSTPHFLGFEGGTPNDTYRPLSMVMFAIEYQFFGLNPAVGHFFNILVFIGCVIMLFLFLDRFFERKKTAVAFIAALLFAVHPVHTEVVANIKSRDELLCYFFGFWSLNLFMNYMKEGRPGQLLTGMLMFFLACISKETVVTFLVIIPVLFFFYSNENKQRSVYITGGAVSATIIFLVIRSVVLNAYHANAATEMAFIDNPLVGAPDMASRIATEFFILGKYLKLMFIPYPLLCSYSYDSIPFTGFSNIGVLLSLLVYGLIVFLGISRLIKINKDPWAFAILFYLVTLSLLSNIPLLIGAEMAERFVFFASTGFCLAAALAIGQWILKADAANIMILKSTKVLVILIPVLLIFSGMTIARNSDWKNNFTLYKTDLEKSSNDSRLYEWLGRSIVEDLYSEETDPVKQRELDREGIGYFNRAIEIYPGYTIAHVQLGWIYNREGMYDSSIAHDMIAIKLDPLNATANDNLGREYFALGKYPEAAALIKKAFAIKPDYKIHYLNLARCYFQMKEYDSAIMYCNKLLAVDPGNADVQQDLGQAYLEKQAYDSAEIHLNKAIALTPKNAAAVNYLGCVYFNRMKYPQAIEQFKKATTIDPANVFAYANMGRAYLSSQQYEAAAAAFRKELSIAPQNPMDIQNLATAYRKMGKNDSAAKYEAMIK